MRFVLQVAPSSCSINPRHHAEGPNRKRYQKAVDDMALMIMSERHLQRWPTFGGRLSVIMTTYVQDNRGVDVDACIKAVLDALQRGKAIANDRNVECLIANRKVDGNPRIEVSVMQMGDES